MTDSRSGGRRPGRVVSLVAGVVVLAAAGVGVWWFTGRADPAAAAAPQSVTTTVAASLSTMEKSVSSSGTLTPTVQEDVSFAVSGTVTAVAVAAGDTVTAGQTLATVDTLELDADLLGARADVATAEASLADLQDADDGTDAAQAQIDAASARVDVAKAAQTAAEEAMADATLVAPAAGLVTSVGIEVGDKVAGSSGSGGMSPSSSSDGSSSAQFTIVGTDAYEVELSVDDGDVALIAPGDQVELTADDLDGTVFGVVRSIGLLSTSTGVASYPVMVDVTGDTSSLHDGISVDASVIYERRTDVLTVPSVAITTNDDGTTTVTKVESDGTTTSTATVTTGETSGSETEITSGLAEGDQVQVVTVTRTGGSSGGDQQQSQFPGLTGTGELPVFPGGQMPDFGQLPGGTQGRSQGRAATGRSNG